MTRPVKRGGVRLGVVLLAAVALLAFAPAALAVQTDQYDPFTACPTDNPALNDPASETAFCVAGTGLGELTIGNRSLSLQRIGIQVAAIGLGREDPDCPQPGFCFGQVPGTTTIEDAPSVFRVGPPGNPKNNPGKGQALQVKVTLERAGDLSALTPAFLFGIPLPVFKLPTPLHVEAPWLSDDCYVGSNQSPIVLGPFVVGAPASFEFKGDPNGLSVETVTFTDMPLEDGTVAVPQAQGCGHGGGSNAKANAKVDEMLGLPSAAGLNKMVFAHANLAFAYAGFDGTAPDGGAALQAAFEAAK